MNFFDTNILTKTKDKNTLTTEKVLRRLKMGNVYYLVFLPIFSRHSFLDITVSKIMIGNYISVECEYMILKLIPLIKCPVPKEKMTVDYHLVKREIPLNIQETDKIFLSRTMVLCIDKQAAFELIRKTAIPIEKNKNKIDNKIKENYKQLLKKLKEL